MDCKYMGGDSWKSREGTEASFKTKVIVKESCRLLRELVAPIARRGYHYHHETWHHKFPTTANWQESLLSRIEHISLKW
jgi:hypothetical protein